VTKEIGLTVI